ncbi:MAG: uroporphyrinogen-III C-methyltransferase / uroporphyrinogen-III synthase [Gemmatimonadetes bacterium]|nr:uroporphyrinogen-III C-methyltransferase / uroporphyrinogen-III synthase [Gemmatimonadota bacterium]
MATVYLVGAGPGDPGLLTVRAASLVSRADVLVYDALVNPAILRARRVEARMVYVGKRGGDHSRTQDEINAILVDLGRGAEACVVRLKGGDPFVFGRGGEEALALQAAGIPFEVVPGVTAGVAAAAYAGIPATQRGMTSSLTLLTGHEDPTKPDTDLDWDALARGGTLVFYMGVGRMEENFRRLTDAGKASDTPAAVIEWGTYPRQRTVTGTLATLPKLAREAGIGAPALVVVGEVVSLRERLRWFDARPLSGRCVLVTRARAQASGLAAELEALGAEVVQFPTIRIADAPDPAALQDAAAGAGGFDWIVFTSSNGVERFWDALAVIGRDSRALGRAKVCAIGPATAAALEARGIRADRVPGEYVGEAVLEALASAEDLAGKRILLPRAEIARTALPDGLRALGAEVVEVAAYRTLPDGEEADAVRARLARDEVDYVTFTASSTVRGFVDLAGTELGGARVVSIGPVTSTTARELGLTVDAEAEEFTIPGLVAALRKLASPENG